MSHTIDVVVEVMPTWLRGTHGAAGMAGSWPANGAGRWIATADEAEEIVERNRGWARVVQVASERDRDFYEALPEGWEP